MNKISKYLVVFFVLASMLLNACAGASPSQSGGGKVEASSIAYTGTIESINGNQWVVNGQTITVDPSVISDGPFNVGDMVKIEVQIAQDGSITVTRVEVPSQVDLSQLPLIGDDNSNSANNNDDNSNLVNGNDVNGNGSNSNDSNGNDGNSNSSNGNDDNSNGSNEVFGVVEAITSTSVTIDGVTYDIQPGGEIKGTIQIGDLVKIHLVQNADGTFSVRELGLSDSSQNGNDNNGNDSNSNSGNANGNSSHSGGSDDNSGGGGNSGGSDDSGGGHGGDNGNG
ncbi:MAG: DUF5666 domain-containing protein [Chloroflexi bacterium]|nr:DUF5666 domain-containing protein [Chloroflexota bacterium]